jgi:hypothetical protein
MNRATRLGAVILIASIAMGCARAPTVVVSTLAPITPTGPTAEPALPFDSPTRAPITTTASPTETTAPAKAPAPGPTLLLPTVAPELVNYVFPKEIDPAKRYLIYIHGRIIEDQGLRAVSPEFGAYEYEAILQKLASYGFVVISEQRSRDVDGDQFARKIVQQIERLLAAGVPPQQITVVGASKGGAITVWVSYLLKNVQTNFVLLGTCHPDTIDEWRQNRVSLYGNVLAINDVTDEIYSGSCAELFAWSAGKIARHAEILLHTGLGHGFLYKPLDEWILPTVEWAKK